MAAELPQEKKKESLLPPPGSAAQQEAEEGHLKVYHRCPKRHVRRRKCNSLSDDPPRFIC
jgi:hypothetical protein